MTITPVPPGTAFNFPRDTISSARRVASLSAAAMSGSSTPLIKHGHLAAFDVQEISEHSEDPAISDKGTIFGKPLLLPPPPRDAFWRPKVTGEQQAAAALRCACRIVCDEIIRVEGPKPQGAKGKKR